MLFRIPKSRNNVHGLLHSRRNNISVYTNHPERTDPARADVTKLRGGSEPSLHGSHLLLHYPFLQSGQSRYTEWRSYPQSLNKPTMYWTMWIQKRHKSLRFQLCLLGGLLSWGLQCIWMIYRGSVPTSQETKRLSIVQIKRNILIVVNSENHRKHVGHMNPIHTLLTCSRYILLLSSHLRLRPLHFTFITPSGLRKRETEDNVERVIIRYTIQFWDGKQRIIYKLMPKRII
jgi:hypothetical protein